MANGVCLLVVVCVCWWRGFGGFAVWLLGCLDLLVGCLVCCCGCYCLVKLVGLDVICLVGFSLMLVVWWCRCYRLL